MSSTRLSPAARTVAVEALTAQPLDVLVIGGGVVGAGVALDAVTRGLSVGLVEMRDWASGSSSRSARLVDGGLGQLPQVHAVTAAVRERDLLLDRLAPHLVKRVPLLRPLHGGLPERITAGSALAVYDGIAALVGSREVVPAHRELARRTVRRIAPSLSAERLTGGVQRYEAVVDDARLGVTLVRTAAGYGAVVASRVRVTGLVSEGDRIVGVRAYDRIAHQELEIRARVVVVAAGAWNGELTQVGGPAGLIGPQQLGVHLVVPRDRIRTSTGLVLAARGPNPVTVLPWGRHWIIGPGISRWSGKPTFPAASGADLQRLLDLINPELALDLQRSDVEGSFASCWPVEPQPDPVQLRPGLIRASSPDLCHYRLAAARATDAAVAELGGLHADSTTDHVPLAGADGFHAQWNQRHLLARRAGLHVARIEQLLNRYGSLTAQVLDLLVAAPELAAPLDAAGDYLCVEAVYAVTHEGARHLTDILARRLRLTTQSRDGGASIAPYVAELVADLLGWDHVEIQRQVGIFTARVDAGRARSAR